jgi:hypothetical protein
MKFAVKTGKKNIVQVVSLKPSSPGCTSGSTGITCTVRIALPSCAAAGKCYSAVVSTYDDVFCNGAPPVCSIPSSAHELSAGQSIPFRVATGKSTSVNLTLSGVPHSMTLTPDALTRPNGALFDLIGPGAHTFTAQTFDADGNAIVGPGAPSYQTSVPTGSLTPVTVTVPSSSPNQVWVAPPATFAATGTATFSVTPAFTGQSLDGCKQRGADCSPASVTVDMQQMVAILGLGGVLNLYAFDEANPRVTLTGLGATGYGLETDSAGDIFAADAVPTVYSPPFSAAGYSRPACCPGANTTAVGEGPNGSALFLSNFPTASGPQNVVSSCTAAKCTRLAYVLPYVQAQVFASDAAGDFVYGYPSVPGGANCFAYAYAAPNYGVPAVLKGAPMSTSGCATMIAMDGSGNAFVSDPSDKQIVEYSKSSGYLTATLIQTGVNPVTGLFADASGNLFDVVWYETCIYYPYDPNPYCYITGTLQETLASSLATHQGGSLSPDLTSSTLGYPAKTVFAMGSGDLYMQYWPDGGLVGYAVPSLAVSYPAPSYTPQPAGLLVLP